MSSTESADDFCSQTPQSHVIELPDGCSVSGESLFDIGECSPDSCHGATVADGTCADLDDNAYCCGPIAYSPVIIPCEDGDEEFTLTVNLVKECGCGLCPSPQLAVAGMCYVYFGVALFT